LRETNEFKRRKASANKFCRLAATSGFNSAWQSSRSGESCSAARFKNGAAISGATNAAYTLTVSSADNHAVFQVFATNTIGVTTYGTGSTTATLTVVVPV